MKRRIGRWLAAMAAAVLMLGSVGCGDDGGGVQGDPAPFEAAMQDYFRTKSFGLKVKEFESLTIEGDTATAEARLMAAEEGAPGVTVRWAFKFEQTGDGWKVVSHEVK